MGRFIPVLPQANWYVNKADSEQLHVNTARTTDPPTRFDAALRCLEAGLPLPVQ